jgi:CHAT domain-containing protein
LAGANHPPKIPDDPAAVDAIPDDGYLTADEIAFMPLSKTDLVVLSACESGLGDTAGGEGFLGIQRAFQVAGARTTIATLWKVDDEWSQKLMSAFYRNVLVEQQSYLDALRNAQLQVLAELRNGEAETIAEGRGADAPARGSNPLRGDPYFWAAFTLSGDWRGP